MIVQVLCKVCREIEHRGMTCAQAMGRAKPTITVANSVSNDKKPVANPEAVRVAEWRNANREKYNARQRDYMRTRRARGRQA